MRKVLTLAIVTDGNRVLLGMKKRGFGEGQWNGFGGKVEEGESIREAAERELEEEVGLTPTEMEEYGVLNFTFESDPLELEVHVFRVIAYTGEIQETEEMRPKWFVYADVPYDEMWPDDVHWLPLLLEGKQFVGKFHFDRPSTLDYRSEILSTEIQEMRG